MKKKPEMRTYYYSAATSGGRMINGSIRSTMRDAALMVEIKDYMMGEGYDEVCILSVWTLD